MPTHCLSFHSSWRCRHAGACCRAGWTIPIEAPAFERVRVHLAGRQDTDSRFVTGGPLPEGAAAILATRTDGTCVFYDQPLCTIHRELGPGTLPIACRQFPRIALHDTRGTFIALSHFCPTAARLLLGGGGIDVIAAPVSLASPDPLEGFDAVHALPPLLNPRVLTDYEGYAEWERQCLQILAHDSLSAEEAVDWIAEGTRRVIEWRPGQEALASAAKDAFGDRKPAGEPWTRVVDEQRFSLACAGVPRGLQPPTVPDDSDPTCAVPAWWPDLAGPARRFVAAHLFGNWVAYHGRTLLTIVEALKISLSVLRVEVARSANLLPCEPVETQFVEAARRADLLLVHLVDIPLFVRSIEALSQARAAR